MEQAIQKAGRAKYGHEHDIRAEIDRKTGEVRLQRWLQVADPVENEFTQITLKAAKKSNSAITVGEFIVDDLTPTSVALDMTNVTHTSQPVPVVAAPVPTPEPTPVLTPEPTPAPTPVVP